MIRKKISIVIIAVLLAMTVSAGLLTYYGRITGTADVKQAVLIDGENYLTSNHFSWHGENYPQGREFIETHVLENKAYTNMTVDLGTTCWNSDESDSESDSFDEEIIWADACYGINTSYVEYFDDAGADFSNYIHSEICSITVEKNTLIQDAIDNANEGDVVCVDPGTYDEDISIDKSITLVSYLGPENTIIKGIDTGFGGAVEIDSPYVTLKGFTIIGAGKAAVYLSEHLRKVTIDSNRLVSGHEATALFFKKPQFNHVINNNEFIGNDASPLVHAGGNNLHFTNNTFAGIIYTMDSVFEMKALQSEIIGNNFTTIGSYAIIKLSGHSVIISGNNFESETEMEIKAKSPCSHSVCLQVDASDNWWGIDGISTSGNIDASYMTKTDFTLAPGEKDIFGIITSFATDLDEDEYSMTLDIYPQ